MKESKKMENTKRKPEHLFRGGVLYKHPSTIWEPIKNEIVAMIIKGVLGKGDKVTSIAETAEKFNCGKSTAQKVLDSLCEENVLCKIHGKGYYVSNTIEDKMEEIEKNYMEELDDAMLRYISKAQKIGLSNEEIVKRVKERL